jgi:hypothetical protein
MNMDDALVDLVADYGHLILRATRREDWGVSIIEKTFNGALEGSALSREAIELR